MVKIEVVNIKTYKGKGEYIGRPSALGNPFNVTKKTPRAESIKKYRVWLWEKFKSKDTKVIAELERLLSICRKEKNLVLKCYCKPLACHGDIIKSCLLWRLSKNS